MDVIWDETIPGGAYWTRVVRRGTTLRLTDPHGSRGVSCLLYNADDPTERYNAADTVKIQNQVYLTAPKLLFSDMGRVLCAITADTSGHHDTLGGCSTPQTNRARYGAGDYQALRNGRHVDARTLFTYALGRHGLGPRDLMPNLNFFTRVRVLPDGGLAWVPGCERPGARLELRAEMNVLVVLANVPHPLHPSPTWDPQPLQLTVLRTPPPGPDDACRTSCPEARRAYDNTDALFLG